MATKIPTKVQFLLADAIRQETGGKLTILGLYSGDIVQLQGEYPKTLPDGQKEIGIPSLAVLATFLDGHGKFKTSVTISDPTGKQLAKSLPQEIEKSSEAPFNFILPFTPFPVRQLGQHHLILAIDKKKFSYFFTVKHVNPKFRLPSAGKPISATTRIATSKKKAELKRP